MDNTFDISIKIRITPEGKDLASAFGPGSATLLQGIKKYRSLNKAAKEMHMAYSKAWKRLKDTETQLGFALIERQGARGSILTPEGEEILALFYDLEAAANNAVQATYQDWYAAHFPAE